MRSRKRGRDVRAAGGSEAPPDRHGDRGRPIVPAPGAARGWAGRRAIRTGAASPPPDVDLSVDLGRGLVLPNPILVASGTFGYGIEYGDVVEVERLGAICCKGTTLRPRIGNPTPRVTETPGGMLNSIGLQNPGVDAVIEKYAATWAGWQRAGASSTSPASRSRTTSRSRAGSTACRASPASS